MKDENYVEFSDIANVSNIDYCIETRVYGCIDSSYFEFDPLANTDDGSCLTLKIYGCTDNSYLEYYWFNDSTIPVDILDYTNAQNNNDSIANIDDGSCLTTPFVGCFNTLATNHDSLVTVNNSSLCVGAFGCMNQNYGPCSKE